MFRYKTGHLAVDMSTIQEHFYNLSGAILKCWDVKTCVTVCVWWVSNC